MTLQFHNENVFNSVVFIDFEMKKLQATTQFHETLDGYKTIAMFIDQKVLI